MRADKKNAEFHVKAIAGTHVVMLAIMPFASRRAELRGFAVKRSANGAVPVWLNGIKYFSALVPNPVKGAEYSSYDQPLQTFFWSDYAADPGTAYTFTIVPRYGTPTDLSDGQALDLRITTEPADDGKHGIWFNRGVVASHKFSQHFQNQRLTDEMANDVDVDGRLLNEEARWLSRGLAEACLAFVNGTKKTEALRVCAYEFTWAPILKALKKAIDRGVDVQIIYHAVDDNEKAIAAAQIPAKALRKRTRPQIPHNKFMVKVRNGKPKQVWTGSTNITATGFLGQTNVGHLVTDNTVAAKYLEYWELLKENPLPTAARANAIRLTPNPPNAIAKNSIVAFYSPRVGNNMLDWYGQRIRDSCEIAMVTLPFNVAQPILEALDTATRSLRLVILETEPTLALNDSERRNNGRLAFSNGAILGKTFVHNARGGAKVAPISQGNLDEWFIEEELARPYNNGHVFFVHSKILLIDPLSTDPLVCTGSANFSTNSLVSNDENMLLIRGDKRVADIYLTELDRIFKHFYDRDAINRSATQGDTPAWLELDTTTQWIDRNFRPGSYKHNRLLTFFPETAGTCAWHENAEQDDDPFADETARADARRRAQSEAAKKRRANT